MASMAEREPVLSKAKQMVTFLLLSTTKTSPNRSRVKNLEALSYGVPCLANGLHARVPPCRLETLQVCTPVEYQTL